MFLHPGYVGPPPAYEKTGSIHTIGDLHHTPPANVVDGELPTNADESAAFFRIGGIACQGERIGRHSDGLQVGLHDERI